MLDKALIPPSRFAIAFSGGGDSTALVHKLRRENPLILIVDHALRPGSADEAQQAQDFADNLGLEAKVLRWQHGPITAGLQARARQARYALMGAMCRQYDVNYLLTAHTADDQAETLLMRYDEGTGWRGAAGMAEVAYAPLWPALAEVTLVRPLLGVTRQALRDYNRAHGLIWIEDPSNANRQFTRIRARDYLADNHRQRRQLLLTAAALRDGLEQETARLRHFYQRHGGCDDDGIIYMDHVPPPRLLQILLRAASGTGGPIARHALLGLYDNMRQAGVNFEGATLAGAFVKCHKSRFYIGRDPVAAKGRANYPALQAQIVTPSRLLIWDGRFAIQAGNKQVKVQTRYQAGSMTQGRVHPLSCYHMSLPKIIEYETNKVEYETNLASVTIRSLVQPRLHRLLSPINL